MELEGNRQKDAKQLVLPLSDMSMFLQWYEPYRSRDSFGAARELEAVCNFMVKLHAGHLQRPLTGIMVIIGLVCNAAKGSGHLGHRHSNLLQLSKTSRSRFRSDVALQGGHNALVLLLQQSAWPA